MLDLSDLLVPPILCIVGLLAQNGHVEKINNEGSLDYIVCAHILSEFFTWFAVGELTEILHSCLVEQVLVLRNVEVPRTDLTDYFVGVDVDYEDWKVQPCEKHFE